MAEHPGAAREQVATKFSNHGSTRSLDARVLATPPLEVFPGKDGCGGLEVLLALVAEALDMDLVLVGHVNPNTYTATAAFCRDPAIPLTKGSEIPIGDTYCREEITARAPFAIGDAAVDPTYREHPGYRKFGLRAYVGVPLLLEDGSLYGTLCATDTRPKEITPEMVDRILLLSGLVAVEISRRLGLKAETEAERALDRASANLRDYTRALATSAAERSREVKALASALQATNRAHEEALRKARAANEELRDFTYTVAHDLSEPLRGIETLTAYLADEALAGSPGEVTDTVGRIRRETVRIKDRVKGLLEFSRAFAQEFDPEPFAFEDALHAVLESLEAQAQEAGARIEVHCQPGIAPIVAQRVRVEQVLRNLLENAIKHNPQGVRIQVGVREAGREHILWVRDDGVGIPAIYHERIFDIFQRGPGAVTTRGSGVGLAMVRRIAERHGGRAWVESTPGEGATFCVALPLSAPVDEAPRTERPLPA